jgi:predicted glycogen debranching enzyme
MSHPLPFDRSAEWIEADGLGGYACGTVDLIRSRRYHSVLTVALRPPTDRVTLVSGFDVWVETPAGRFALSSQRYLPDVVHPDGASRLVGFSSEPWPQWTFRLPDGTEVVHELTVPRDQPIALVSWRLAKRGAPDPGSIRLRVRPLLSCRDAHSLHHANPSFVFDADSDGELVRWHPYHGIPGVAVLSNGAYLHEPLWHHSFLYTAERDRGGDFTEDLASPGMFEWDLDGSDAAMIVSTDSADLPPSPDAASQLAEMRDRERARRAGLGSRLLRSAEAFLVRRGSGRTILAGYPWSTEWGRDTFVAMRGLCLATGRLGEAREILLEWADRVASGLLPSFFPERPDRPEFASADTSLWYVIAIHEYMRATAARGEAMSASECSALRSAVASILDAYVTGTKYGIGMDDDGLLRAGEPGTPVTWMDARLGDWAVAPRVGKAVEVQALWINALRIAAQYSSRWDTVLERANGAFLERFWHGGGGYLHDVVDVDHRRDAVDSTLRPNQILAVGGLPFAVVHGAYAARIVEVVEKRLLTPMGLRTLAPTHASYVGRCEGNERQTLAATHMGTVWPWLLGPFVEAWVRVRGDTAEARREARARFLTPVLRHLDEAGIGHVSELADGDRPHAPRGAPFQAWSLGEMLRLCIGVLAPGCPPADALSVDAAARDVAASR